ncbi:MAG: hypothetical protein CMJ89_13615 [Planctomycetes bacterium]|nr:hypothetical protein [Planctomycetota bacterium]
MLANLRGALDRLGVPGTLRGHSMESVTLRIRSLSLTALALSGCGPGGPGRLEPVELGPEGKVERRVGELVAEHVARVRSAPGDALAHGTLGLVYQANELWAEAAASYGNAAMLDPSEALWRFHRAIALQQRGGDEEAFELLLQAAEELSEEAAVLQRLGDAYLERGEPHRAKKLFEGATHHAPGRAEGFHGLGAVCWELQDSEGAREALERAVLLDPSLHAAHYLLGTVYREMGRVEEAGIELALGLNRTPKGDPRLRGNRALPGPFARDIHRYAVTRNALMRRAIGQIERGKLGIARRLLEELHHEHPQDLAVLNNLAVSLLHLGETEEALRLWNRALEMDPDSVDTHMALAGGLLDQGFTSRATEHAVRVLELAPELGESHYAYARVLVGQGASEAALDALEHSLELDPRRTDAWLLAGDLLLELERHAEASRHYRRAVRTRPDSVAAHLGMARAAVGLGRRQAALKAFEAAKRYGPSNPAVAEFARELNR